MIVQTHSQLGPCWRKRKLQDLTRPSHDNTHKYNSAYIKFSKNRDLISGATVITVLMKNILQDSNTSGMIYVSKNFDSLCDPNFVALCTPTTAGVASGNPGSVRK